MANVKIYLNKTEIGAAKRGSSLGIDALKIVSLNHDKSFFKEAEQLESNNDVLFEERENFPHALYIDEIDRIYSFNHQMISNQREGDENVIFISADHSQTSSYLAGIKNFNPDLRIGIIWIDAHGDLHSPYTTPSGNVHGMTLAMALGEDNIENKRNDPDENTILIWNDLKRIAGEEPLIKSSDLAFIGLRDLEKEEIDLLERKDIKYYLGRDAIDSDIKKVAKDTLEHLSNCDIIFVSFDVDSMDPDKVSYGTGTPVRYGLSKEQASELIDLLTKHEKVTCFEITEINPLLDDNNKMAEKSFELLQIVKKNFESK